MAEDDDRLALAGVALAVLAWGCFTVPMKARAVSSVSLDPFVYQLYMSCGISASSLLFSLSPAVPLAWTWWSAVAASFWVPGSILTVYIVRHVGIAIGQGTWSGTNALVAFLWGQLYFKAGMRSPLLGTLGLVVLISSIFALSFTAAGCDGGVTSSTVTTLDNKRLPMLSEPLLTERPQSRPLSRAWGILLALFVGICGGTSHAAFCMAPQVMM